MNGQLPVSSRSGFESFVLNVASLVAWWLLLTLWIRTQFPRGLSDWRVGELTILAACIIGVPAALAIRRTGAAYVLAGFVAFGAIEFAFHSVFGSREVQGGPAHFSDMTAGTLGVTFAALAETFAGRFPRGDVWDAHRIGTSLLRAGIALRRSLGAWSPVALGIIAFAITEVAGRVFFGWIFYINGWGWRLRHLFLDGRTNYAILLCALLGAAIGTAIAKWGDLIALPFPTRKQSEEIAAG